MKLPQLSLRDLFWLVALVAMGCGWWAERNRLINAASHFRAEAEALSHRQGLWGTVTDVNEARSLVEISLGTDNGLRKGTAFEAWRGTQYLGQFILIQTESDRSVGESSEKSPRRALREGDSVTTSITNGTHLP